MFFNIVGVSSDVVLSATPIDLNRFISISRPVVRINSIFQNCREAAEVDYFAIIR
jgi:predicted GTPase